MSEPEEMKRDGESTVKEVWDTFFLGMTRYQIRNRIRAVIGSLDGLLVLKQRDFLNSRCVYANVSVQVNRTASAA
jgi:hypothetical protein